MNRAISLCLVLLACGHARASEPSLPVRVSSVLRDLDDARPDIRERGQLALENLPPESLPLLDAAIKGDGLGAEAQVAVRNFLRIFRGRAAVRMRLEKRKTIENAATAEAFLQGYRKFGSRSPAWDASMEKLIDVYTHEPTLNSGDLPRWSGELWSTLKEVRTAKCDDALSKYIFARSFENSTGGQSKPDQMVYQYRRAAEAMETSGYPNSIKCPAYLRAAHMAAWRWNEAKLHEKYYGERKEEIPAGLPRVDPEMEKSARHFLAAAMPLWPDLVSDLGEARLGATLEFGASFLQTSARLRIDRKSVLDKLRPPLEKATTRKSEVLTWVGAEYVRWAWDARGGGWANTVTPEGWKDMGERLAIAEKLLTEAWELDKINAQAATQMLTVELGQSKGRDVMELWFKRAMEANPDNLEACYAKLYYLEPKWHGSVEEMVKFARECVAEGNWQTTIPLILLDAHRVAASYVPDPDAYRASDEVWRDVQLVCEGYLKRFPQVSLYRARYIQWAVGSRKWAVAQRQLDLLGDKPDMGAFGGRPRYDELVRKTREGLAAATRPATAPSR